MLERTRTRRLPPPAVRRALRERVGLTQADIASVLGVDRATVSRYETGKRTARGDLATAYRALLDRLAREALP